jgi:hypothetical protein
MRTPINVLLWIAAASSAIGTANAAARQHVKTITAAPSDKKIVSKNKCA